MWKEYSLPWMLEKWIFTYVLMWKEHSLIYPAFQFPFKNTSTFVKYCFTFCYPPLRFLTYWFIFWFSMLSFLKSQITSEFTFIDISVQVEATVAWQITVDYLFSGHYNFNLEQASPVVIIANWMWFIRLHLYYWAKQGPGTCLSSTMW